MAKQTERTRKGGSHRTTPSKPSKGSPDHEQEKRDADEASDHRGES